jgi:acetyltransferase
MQMNIRNNIVFRTAHESDLSTIWEIITFAKEVRRREGSSQWQDGYPDIDTIRLDIVDRKGYLLLFNDEVCGYMAVVLDGEPAYDDIEGCWLSNRPYTTVHRMAVSSQAKGKGLGYTMLLKAEEISLANSIYSIRVDTNYDNTAMLHIFEKLGYVYCGEVYYRGNPRKAFEKLLFD